MGMRNTIMLTGDNAVVARATAAGLGLTRQYADMLPADKAEVIQDLRRDGNVVAMVGDGLNDSPRPQSCRCRDRHDAWCRGHPRIGACRAFGGYAVEGDNGG